MKTCVKTAMAAIVLSAGAYPALLLGHCDTLDGPVVVDARAALAKGDVAPVLKWVKKEKEPEIRTAFARTGVVRKQSKEAAELADMYFFETLVRIHREGEGAPYTGLKPAGEVEPGIAGADQALEDGKIDEFASTLGHRITEGVRIRHEKAAGLRKHKDESADAGREYVEAYVDYIHYCERVFAEGGKAAGHAHGGHGDAEGSGARKDCCSAEGHGTEKKPDAEKVHGH